ncbi:NADH dehydrogenase [ubiquinone] 1 alpha subcomplex subunit 2 [Cimex lectularius]|uniref:NADH dehydrogenase [ubiquinone] 1 alpha subcomplex subunit 2 n=1 Tax=Cimex lectularius TaxID=79782 RepID=A0A8I6RV82_CIMLE|nr:NADH dehydrogenase [ubiquinone] 1 alpha subcomplex subunit 2 [Cimex lectularius]
MSAVRFGNHLKELRLHFCQKSESSKGVREFVEKHYVGLKQANPKFPILIRECDGVRPRLWARYQFGQEKSASLEGLGSSEVLSQLNNLAKA